MDKETRQNKVLSGAYKKSNNFFESDVMLHHHLGKILSDEAKNAIEQRLSWMGNVAANGMDFHSLKADKMPPTLVKRDQWGEDIDHIEFHPSYWLLVEYAVRSGMFAVKWHPEFREKLSDQLNKMSFGISYLYAMAETGIYCPLCMTDGVAVLIDRYCKDEDKERLLPSIYASAIEDLKTGAMYLTEKAGGSDVGANLVTATHYRDDLYLLNGEKWFCSNANGEIAFVLARTNPEITGTKGLSIFLVEKTLPDGSANPMNIVRLKDKLGVKSMASAEIILTNTVGKLVGEEFKGFKVMTEMINLSRVYNSVAAQAASRRALSEAYQFLRGRETFGKNAMQHPLVRVKLEELGALNVANFYLTWRAVEALDNEHDENEQQLLRLLTPMVKRWSADRGVYITRESMELMGGIGYIEDQVMPKLMRDIMVLPIWEGAGNIMILDMLRAAAKSNGLTVMLKEIIVNAADSDYAETLGLEVQKLKATAEEIMRFDQDVMQASSKPFFDRLTTVYQMSLMVKNLDGTSENWMLPALDYFKKNVLTKNEELVNTNVLSQEEIDLLLAWKV
ncbi:acyl-CoA dehydrogenase family protein [Parvicella tangerina]|uniref:Crotonobetainyl-CoA reductase n=1 Tax=Parvicella tangerina TaxID=2829795 RepID=A0A916JIW9_9FLAO|nr:acyl-CoA dehydrogenase family protein [Parvicella tangerina]CAG5076312.1 Crotonobetainyl-CoA reductase [Parvicella tangerina]